MRRFVAWFVGGASALGLFITVATAGASAPDPGDVPADLGKVTRMDEPPAPPEPPEPPLTKDGPGIYKASCNKCHGSDGIGKKKLGDKLRAQGKKMSDLTTSNMELDKIIETVTNGVPKSSMKGYKDKMSAEQIAAVAAYARAFRK